MGISALGCASTRSSDCCLTFSDPRTGIAVAMTPATNSRLVAAHTKTTIRRMRSKRGSALKGRFGTYQPLVGADGFANPKRKDGVGPKYWPGRCSEPGPGVLPGHETYSRRRG